MADRLGLPPTAPSPTCPRWPARPGESIYDTALGDPGWEDFGGTSLASPIIASVYALAYPDVPTSTTYASPSSLFDVTSGSNGSCGGTYLCTGLPGYDGPTGLGTPCGTADFGTGPFTTPALLDVGADPARAAVALEAGVRAVAGVHAGLRETQGGLRQLRRRPHHQEVTSGSDRGARSVTVIPRRYGPPAWVRTTEHDERPSCGHGLGRGAMRPAGGPTQDRRGPEDLNPASSRVARPAARTISMRGRRPRC